MAQNDIQLAKQIARPFGIAEDLLGFVFANVMTLYVGTIFLWFSHFDSRPGSQRTIILLIAAAWLGFDLPFSIRLWRAMIHGPRPATHTAASTQFQLPGSARLLAASWWLAHFAIGAAFIIAFHVATALQRKHDAKHVPEWLTAVLAMCVGFAANGYLLLAVCALTRRENIRRFIWRSRALIDIALGMLGYILSQQIA